MVNIQVIFQSKRFWLTVASVLTVALVAVTSFADDNQPLTITQSGYYLTVLDQDGAPAYVRLATVIDLTDGKNPTPDQPDQPAVDKELVDKVRDLAKSIDDPASAQAIAAVYAHIRGAVEDGTLDSTTVWGPLKQATDSALALIGGKDWTAFRANLTGVFTLAQQRGELGSAKQVGRILLSVQQGVELAADGATAISFEHVVEIARRTNTAIDGVTK